MKVKPFSVEKIRIPTDFSEFGHQRGEVVDLAGCENCRTSEKALAALRNCSPNMLIEHWQSQDKLLRERLGEIHNVNPSNVYLTSGAMGAIGYSFDVFVDRDTRVGLLRPDFSGFQYYADKAKAKTSWLENTEFPYSHANQDIIDFVRNEDIGFLITSNPSAVTGTLRKTIDVEEIVGSNPETMHVIDEADSIYPNLSSADLTKKYGNVIHLGSFSKFYGLSGLRIGYLITPETHSDHFDRMINPIEVTSTAILAAQMAINDEEYQRDTQERVGRSLSKMEGVCEGSSYRIVPGSKCFASYLDADHSIKDPHETLTKLGVKIAKGSTFGLNRGGRVNLANEDNVDKLVDILQEIK